MLELLARASVKATFFVLGEIALARPRLISTIAAAGHELACHGFHHLPVDAAGPGAFAEDLDRAVVAISDAAGIRPRGYRAPIWSLSRAPWCATEGIDILVSRGFTFDSSLVPVPVLGECGLPAVATMMRGRSGSILELPPLTGRCGPWRFPLGFGLGLRLLPAAMISRAIVRENAAGRPAVVAFHPWELDPQPPALRLSPSLEIAHGFGLERLSAKLADLMKAVPFGPVEERWARLFACREAA